MARQATAPHADMSLLSDLSVIEPGHAGLFTDAVTAAAVTGWSYYFPYLALLGSGLTSERLYFETSANAVLVYRYRVRKGITTLSLLMPPFPWDRDLLIRGLDRSAAFNADGVGRISRVPEAAVVRVAREDLEFRLNMREYIYDRAAVVTAAGRGFAGLRRKLARYRDGGTVIRPFEAADAAPCDRLLTAWRAGLEARGIRLGPYRHYARRCLHEGAQFGTLLHGEVIEVGDAVAAFTFGGPIDQTAGSVFVTVSDHAHPGLAYLQRASLMRALPDLAYFNDGTDTGRAGMAQMKRAFRPVRMHHVYAARTLRR